MIARVLSFLTLLLLTACSTVNSPQVPDSPSTVNISDPANYSYPPSTIRPSASNTENTKKNEHSRTLADMYQDDQCARKAIQHLVDTKVVSPSHELSAYCFEHDLIILGHTEHDIHQAIVDAFFDHPSIATIHDHTSQNTPKKSLYSVHSLEKMISNQMDQRPKHLKIVTDRDDVYLLGRMSQEEIQQLTSLLSEQVQYDQVINYIQEDS